MGKSFLRTLETQLTVTQAGSAGTTAQSDKHQFDTHHLEQSCFSQLIVL